MGTADLTKKVRGTYYSSRSRSDMGTGRAVIRGFRKLRILFGGSQEENIYSFLVSILGSSHLRKLPSRSAIGITSGVVIKAVGL